MAECSCPNYDPIKCVPEVEHALLEWHEEALSLGLHLSETCWPRLLDALDAEDCSAVSVLECRAFAGDKEAGEACTRFNFISDDCAEDLACHFTEDGSICASAPFDIPILEEGEPCVSLFALCDPAQDLVCDSVLDACVVPPPIGSPCETGTCGSDAWCDFEDDDGPVCKARTALGTPCSEGSTCQSGFCDGERCAESGGTICFVTLLLG